MTVILSALPVLATILALICGLRSLSAALLGVAMALLAIIFAFPIPMSGLPSAISRWLPILIEVLLIIGGGLLLSEVLRRSGGQLALAEWLRGRAGQGVGAVLLVVHGVTPFAESLTGFGIGVTIGIPLLAHFGLPLRKVAMIGLLGLCAVPWGSMGPGTLIAASMSGLGFRELGLASAVLSVIPFVATGMLAAGLAAAPERRRLAVVQGAVSGLVLTLAITAANTVFGTAPAGALGALVMILLHLARGSGLGGAQLGAIGKRALSAYALLLGGVLLGGWLFLTLALSPGWRYIGSPALWLFIAVLWFARGRPDAIALREAWRAWRVVAPVNGLFILLGVLMAVSGMAAYLALWLSRAGEGYVIAAPFVGAMGGFVTGSNSGANAMFATTQAEIARALGIDVLWFMAAHNVAAAFLLMASPGKIEMALALAQSGAAADRAWLQRQTLWLALLVVAALALVNMALVML